MGIECFSLTLSAGLIESGRYKEIFVGDTVKKSKGRPKVGLLPTIQTQFWILELEKLSGTKNRNQLDELYFPHLNKRSREYAQGKHAIEGMNLINIDTIYRRNEDRKEAARQEALKVNKDKIQKAKDSGIALSNELEALLNEPMNIVPGNFWRIGPLNKAGDHIPLWKALDGPVEDAWEAIFFFDPPVELQHYIGLSFRTKLQSISLHFFGQVDLPDDLADEGNHNSIAKAYKEKKLSVDLELLAAVIAAWRLSTAMGDSKFKLDYIMLGLLDQAAEDLIRPLGFWTLLEQFLIDIDRPHIEKFEKAFERYKSHQSYPEWDTVTQKYAFDKIGGFSHYIELYKGTRVSEFLELKRSRQINHSNLVN